MGPLVFLLFVALPLVELLLLVWIGTKIGFWYTVSIVLATGVLGALLARWQGPRAWREITGAWRDGRVPAAELVAGAVFLVGAAFLLTPGVITDIVGFLLMIPPLRRWTARRVLGRFHFRARHHDSDAGRVVRVRKIDDPDQG